LSSKGEKVNNRHANSLIVLIGHNSEYSSVAALPKCLMQVKVIVFSHKAHSLLKTGEERDAITDE